MVAVGEIVLKQPGLLLEPGLGDLGAAGGGFLEGANGALDGLPVGTLRSFSVRVLRGLVGLISGFLVPCSAA